MYKKYQVQRVTGQVKLDGNWTGGVWADVEPLDIKEIVVKDSDHKPKTQAKLLYDDKFIHVIFRVEDNYLRAVAKKYHDPVFEDSCVEFFFTPGTDISEGYFNLETNCGGMLLCRHQITQGVNGVLLESVDCDKIEIYHTEPETIDPEKAEPTTWLLQYRLPLEILQKYAPVVKPAAGVTWRANFYKCGEQTSHPHGQSWSVIDSEEFEFHFPEFFGTLEFK